MKWVFPLGLLASLMLHASAQPSRDTVDELYQRGQSEMAPNWRAMGKSHNAAVYIHQDMRKSEKGEIAIWTHREFPSPEYFEKETTYLSTRERMLVDCKSGRLGVTDASLYAERFGKGSVVSTSRFKTPDMIDAVPDSIEDKMVKTACAPKPRSSAPAKAKPAKPAAPQTSTPPA